VLQVVPDLPHGERADRPALAVQLHRPHRDELPPPGQQLVQQHLLRRRLLARAGLQPPRELREHAGVDAVGLGQGAHRLGEAPDARRVDHGDGGARRHQLDRGAALEPAGRLDDQELDAVRPEPAGQRLDPGRGVRDGERERVAGRVGDEDLHVERALGDVHADERGGGGGGG
jgi:hypothetical protein